MKTVLVEMPEFAAAEYRKLYKQAQGTGGLQFNFHCGSLGSVRSIPKPRTRRSHCELID